MPNEDVEEEQPPLYIFEDPLPNRMIWAEDPADRLFKSQAWIVRTLTQILDKHGNELPDDLRTSAVHCLARGVNTMERMLGFEESTLNPTSSEEHQ